MVSLSHDHPHDDPAPAPTPTLTAMPAPDERSEAVRSAILRYLDEGREVIEYDEDKKGPHGRAAVGWQRHTLTREEVVKRLIWHRNVGVLMGEVSGQLYGVDPDAPQAPAFCRRYLPSTDSIFGRDSDPYRRFLFECPEDEPQPRKKFVFAEAQPQRPGETGAPRREDITYIELLGGTKDSACQSMMPPSIHPVTRETLRWTVDGKPARVRWADLQRSVATIASAVLLVRHWPDKCHETTLALTGALVRIWDDDAQVDDFVGAILEEAGHGGHEPTQGLAAAARARLAANSQQVAGFPKLADYLRDGERVVKKLQEWLPGASAREQRERQRAQQVVTLGAMPTGASGLPQIGVTDRPLRDKADDALTALVAANDPIVIYARAGSLMRLRRDEDDDHPIVQYVTDDMLADRLTRVADFLEVRRFGPEHVDPPRSIVRNLLTRSAIPELPTLLGIVQAPVLRADGTLLDTEGYDPTSHLFYAPPPGLVVPPIPAPPTRAQVQAARAWLAEHLLGTYPDLPAGARGKGFPFDSQASRTNAVALLLTPLVRPMINGHVPLAVVDASKAGTGKTLLTHLTAIGAVGRPLDGVVNHTADDDEFDKRLTTVMRNGPAVVLIDNLDRPLRSGRLASLLTMPNWHGRIIGHSREVDVPQRAAWMVTGNNIRLGGDMPRRCYWIRMDAKLAHPEDRKPEEFAHPELVPWALAHRGEVLANLLTLALGWVAAGCPDGHAPTMGSFEEWTRVLDGILAYAEYPDFLGNRAAMYERTAAEDREWELFFGAWAQYFADQWLTTHDLVLRFHESHGRMESEGKTTEWPDLIDLLPDRLAETYERAEARAASYGGSFAKALGKALSEHVDTRYSDPTTGSTVHLERWNHRARKTYWRVVKDID